MVSKDFPRKQGKSRESLLVLGESQESLEILGKSLGNLWNGKFPEMSNSEEI